MHKFAISAALLACVLTGCSTSAPSSGPTVPTTSTAIPPVLSSPRSALSLECSALFPIARVQALLSDPVAIKIDEMHPPRRIEELAVLQAGGTECAWGGQNMTDSTWDTGIVLEILPLAATEFASWESSGSSPKAVTGTIGDESGFQCGETSDTGGDWCSGDALVKGYWISFSVNDVDGAHGGGVAATESAMAEVVAGITAAGPARANWTPPVTTITGGKLCSDPAAAARVSAIVGDTLTASAPNVLPNLTAVAATRVGLVSCAWRGPHGEFDVSTLPAGAWAYPLVVAHPPMWTMLGAPASFAVSGADGAVRACGDGCQAQISVDGSLVQIYTSADSDVSGAFSGTVQKAIDAILAA